MHTHNSQTRATCLSCHVMSWRAPHQCSKAESLLPTHIFNVSTLRPPAAHGLAGRRAGPEQTTCRSSSSGTGSCRTQGRAGAHMQAAPVVVADAAATPQQQALSRLSGLQVLLRFLPLRGSTPNYSTTRALVSVSVRACVCPGTVAASVWCERDAGVLACACAHPSACAHPCTRRTRRSTSSG
jgi:hypothetical protein